MGNENCMDGGTFAEAVNGLQGAELNFSICRSIENIILAIFLAESANYL